MMIAGEMMMPMGAPVAVIVGDGPIAITWGDGTKTDLVVAAVVTPRSGTNVKKDFASMAKKHVDLVRKTAAAQPTSVLGDSKALQALEMALLNALNGTLTSGGYINEVSAAEAEKGPRKEVPAQNEAMEEEAPAGEVMQEASAPSEAEPALEQAAAAPKRAPKAKKFWSACRRAGCTSCGS